MSTLLDLMLVPERAPTLYAPDFCEPWQDAEEPFRYALGYPVLSQSELSRTHRGTVLWVMFNPSTATALRMDATIRKVAEFTRRWGYGRFLVGNLYARRGTDPKNLVALLKDGQDVIGVRNQEALARMAAQASRIIVAWGGLAGISKRFPPRHRPVLDLLQDHGDVHSLGSNNDGSPPHPLMLAYETPLELYARKHP